MPSNVERPNKRMLTELPQTLQREAFYHAEKALKSISAGTLPRTPLRGAYDASLDSLVGWGEGNPSLYLPH